MTRYIMKGLLLKIQSKESLLHAYSKGSVMVEFVLVTPILCFFITGLLFIRHEIDYTQDSVVHFKNPMWDRSLPENFHKSYFDENFSDEGGFGSFQSIRQQVAFAPFLSGNMSLLAMERYPLTGTPYHDRLNLAIDNYHLPNDELMIAGKADMLFNPWTNILINLATYSYRHHISEMPKEGLTREWFWAERFPMVTDSWQRTLLWSGTQAQEINLSRDLEIISNPISFPIMEIMNVLTLYESQTYDKGVMYSGGFSIFSRHIQKTDLNDGDTRNNPLIHEFSQGMIWNIVK